MTQIEYKVLNQDELDDEIVRNVLVEERTLNYLYRVKAQLEQSVLLAKEDERTEERKRLENTLKDIASIEASLPGLQGMLPENKERLNASKTRVLEKEAQLETVR